MAKKKYSKRPDGYYTTTVWDGTYKPDGSKHRRHVYGKTIRELDARVREIEDARENGRMVIKDGRLWIAFCRDWFDTTKAHGESATREMYKNVVNTYLSIFPDLLLCDFSMRQVNVLLKKADGKPETQRKILLTTKQILQAAVREGRYSAKDAEALFAIWPRIKHKAKEKRPLTAAEKEAIFAAELEPMDKCFLYLIYGCGLRREEALALTTKDVVITDAAGEVHITKARALIGGTDYEEKEPKTARGTRTVPIPKRTRTAIKDYISILKPGAELFPGVGKNRYDTMWHRIIRAMQAVCKEPIEGLTAHIFRHSYVTELCYQIPKLSLKNVARLVGDSETVVLGVYDHLDLTREDAAAVVDDAF